MPYIFLFYYHSGSSLLLQKFSVCKPFHQPAINWKNLYGAHNYHRFAGGTSVVAKIMLWSGM